MTTFLIYYSDVHDASDKKYPRVGTAIEISTLADLDALACSVGNNCLVLHPISKEEDGPYWLSYADLQTDEDLEDNYAVNPFPGNAKKLRWIEVYYGYRE